MCSWVNTSFAGTYWWIPVPFFFYFQSLFDFLGYYLDPALSTEFHYEILLNFSPTRNYLHLVPGPVLGAWDMSVRTSSSAPARSCLHPALLPFHLFHLPFPAELSLTSELCIGQAGPTWTALWIPTEFYCLLAPGIICPVGLGPGLRVYCLMSVVFPLRSTEQQSLMYLSLLLSNPNSLFLFFPNPTYDNLYLILRLFQYISG